MNDEYPEWMKTLAEQCSDEDYAAFEETVFND